MDSIYKILFEKPNISALRRSHTVVDMHFHSHFSDGRNSIKEIAAYARRLGIGVAIADHNEIRGAVEINRYKSVLSIPAIEVTSREGTHVLVYFYDIPSLKKFYQRDIRPQLGDDLMSSIGLGVEEIVRKARRYKTVVIFPHPYCAVYTGVCNQHFSEERRQRFFEMVDGVEAINAENLKKWNLQCALLGFNLNKAITGGSDGHTLTHLGRAVSYADCPKERKAFLDAVRKRLNKVVGKEIAFFRKVKSNGLKLRSSIRNYPDLMEKNIKYSRTVFNNKSKELRESFLRNFSDRRRKHHEAV